MSLADIVVTHRDNIVAYYEAIHEYVGPEGVAWDPSIGAWIVSKYALCSELLESRKLQRQRIDLPRGRNPDLVECAEGILKRQLMFNTESQLRRDYWQRRATAVGDEHLRQIAETTLDSVTGTDLYADVLQPFASRIAAACVDLDEEYRSALYPLINGCVRFLDGKLRSERDFDLSMLSIVMLYDRLGTLYRTSDAGSKDAQWLADLMLTLVAGHESTAYLLGTVFLQEKFPNASATISKLIIESIRFDSPVQMIGRKTLVDTQVGGVVIPADSRIFIHIGAANRDLSAFEHAHRFIPTRRGPPLLSFGLGEGQCLGRSLAIRSAHVFLTVLRSRRQWFAIGANVHRTTGISGRGFESLPARLVAIAESDLATEAGDAVK